MTGGEEGAAAWEPGTGTRRRAATTRRTGRRPGHSGTRKAILDAARKRFARYGYLSATMRDIAADAGVAPPLVYHFFSSKELLFVAAMRLPAVPSDVLSRAIGPDQRLPADGLGGNLIRTMLTLWEVSDIRMRFLGLLRAALTNEQALSMLAEFLTETGIGAIARSLVAGDHAGTEEARYRASLVASQVLGVGLARYVLQLEPLASATIDDLTAAIGPAIQRYLTGEITG